MKCLILKTFEYTDAQNVSTLTAYEDDTVEIPDDLVAGLFKEGFVTDPDNPELRHDDDMRRKTLDTLSNKDAGAAPENAADTQGAQTTQDPEPVEIPDNWAELPWQDLRALAAKVSENPIKDKDGAIDAITVELAARGQAPAQD